MVTAYTRADSGPLVDADVGAVGQARVELARPDYLLLLLQQLDPVGQPAGGSGDREEHSEHLGGESTGLVDESGVGVDVRVEPPRREVLVGERGLLALERDVEQRVLAGDGEDLVSRLLDDLRPGVVALVDAVAEALEQALALLHRLDERRYLVDRADLLEHADEIGRAHV